MDFTKISEQDFFSVLDVGTGSGLTTQRNLLQGLEIWKLRGLFNSDKRKDVYKLILNSVWERGTTVDFEKQSIKGAFGLVKATWGESTGAKNNELRVEKIEVGKANKVWLIVAKGKNNVYLMPVVRTSGKCGWYGTEWTKQENAKIKGEVDSKGIENIGEWTKKNDQWSTWWDNEDKRLQKAMGSGFSITRKAEVAVFSEDKVVYEWSRAAGEEEIKEIGKGGTKSIGNLYRNAGILMSEKDKSFYCSGGEAYFPLDLVILSNSSKVTKPQIKNTGTGQEITITDEI